MLLLDDPHQSNLIFHLFFYLLNYVLIATRTTTNGKLHNFEVCIRKQDHWAYVRTTRDEEIMAQFMTG